MRKYSPAPIDTSDIYLSEDLIALTEVMAKNVHEVWSLNRFNEGWSYGPERNDKLKTHPCLIEYEKLSDAEKQYDRETAINTLKLIISLGYTISK